MSGELSKYLSYIIGKQVGGMTDREAKAWAEKEEAENDLRREREKVAWLCKVLEKMDSDNFSEKLAKTNDGRYHPLETGKTAIQWEMLAELALEMDRQRGDAWKK